jgi:hypothetical protein
MGSNVFLLKRPEMNTIFYDKKMGMVYRVCYINEGKNRVTLEAIAYFRKRTPLKDATFKLIEDQGKDGMSFAEFNELRRARWSKPSDDNKPTKSTLDVDSGSVKQSVTFRR